MDRKQLYENALIIAPRERWPFYLAYRREYPDASFKLMTKEEVEGLFQWQYDDRATIHLIRKGTPYQLANDQLKAIKWIDLEKVYSSKRLNELQAIAKELSSLGLIYKTEAPEMDFAGKNILISGYSDTEWFAQISERSGVPNLAVSHDNGTKIDSSKEILRFTNIYEECHYVINHIMSLIEAGTSIEDIWIAGANDDYKSLLWNMGLFYDLGFEDFKEHNALESEIGRFFMKSVYEAGFEVALEALKDEYAKSDDFNSVYLALRTFHIEGMPSEEESELIKATLRAISLKKEKIRNVVRFLKSSYAPIGSTVIHVCFTMGNAPHTEKDIGYLKDKDLKELGRPTSAERNHSSKTELVHMLDFSNVSLLTRSRYLRSNGEQIASPLLSDKALGLSEREGGRPAKEYSKAFAKVLASHFLDGEHNLLKFDPKGHALVESFKPEYKPYQKIGFDPITSIPKDAVIKYSYSSIENFFECPFKYYVSNVLKIKDFEGNFNTYKGHIFHKTIQLYYQGIPVEEAYEQAIKMEEESIQGTFIPRARFILDRLFEDVKWLCSYMSDNEKKALNPKILNEFEIVHEHSKTITFKGDVDKAITTGNNGEFLSIIDFKSRIYDQYVPEYMEHGLCLQLPFYAYLASKDKRFASKEIIGLFLNQLLRDDPKGTDEDDRIGQLGMRGVKTPDQEKLNTLIGNADSQWLIKKPQAITKEQLDNQKALVEKKVLEADKKIRAGLLGPSPAKIKVDKKKAKDACEHCNFKEICHKRPSDVRWLGDMHKGGDEEQESEDEAD